MELSELLLLTVCVSCCCRCPCDGASLQEAPHRAPEPADELQQTHLDHANHSAPFSASGQMELAGLRSFPPEELVETRVTGGQEAWAHSWPWQVSLCFATMPACGGAVLSPLWVISAAHCFRRYRKATFWTVMAGKHDLDDPAEPSQVVGVSSIVVHRGYDARTKENDVALLRLKEPLVFTQHVRPIRLWMAPLPTNRNCTVTGWGATRENGPRAHRLQEVNVTVLPWTVCNGFYSGRMRASMFCAGRAGGGADACQGDSGGPLSCRAGSRFLLAGVVSWGIGCGRAKRPGVYTAMRDYSRWIYSRIGDDGLHSDDSAGGAEEEEEECGRRDEGSCPLEPQPAGVSVREGAEPVLENVTEACPGQWPWQVSLQVAGSHYCSGTLVHPRWVLAPRHCHTRAGEDTVVLGVHDLNFFSSQTVPVDEVFQLPQDGRFPATSDLSLLRLGAPARLNTHVSPICVPDEDEDDEPDDGWSCVTAGWGSTGAAVGVAPTRLHHAAVSVLNQTACRQQWGQEVTETHICVQPAASPSCMGDSGAPLFCRKRGPYFLFGVTTGGGARCDGERAAIFSRISTFGWWLSEVTEDD